MGKEIPGRFGVYSSNPDGTRSVREGRNPHSLIQQILDYDLTQTIRFVSPASRDPRFPEYFERVYGVPKAELEGLSAGDKVAGLDFLIGFRHVARDLYPQVSAASRFNSIYDDLLPNGHKTMIPLDLPPQQVRALTAEVLEALELSLLVPKDLCDELVQNPSGVRWLTRSVAQVDFTEGQQRGAHAAIVGSEFAFHTLEQNRPKRK